MDHRKLRDILGFFATGVVIACARKRKFLSRDFFPSIDLSEAHLVKRAEKFWRNFFSNHPVGIKFEKRLSQITFLEKIKAVFADEFFGMTVNSFSSLSLDPPLVLFCIDNNSSNLSLFRRNKYFSLNILSQNQKSLSTAFATPKNSEKWGVEPYSFGKFGNPIFENSIAFIECKKHRIIRAGDHHIIIGEVIDFSCLNNSKPLLYYCGQYSSLS